MGAPSLRVVGNLPYNISTPILFHLLDHVAVVQDQHFMLQKEVIDRMVAPPSSKDYSRLSRAVGDMALARAEKTSAAGPPQGTRAPLGGSDPRSGGAWGRHAHQRFYSFSAQILRERKDYYDQLEATQKGPLDVTPWLHWFLGCLLRAVQGANTTLAGVLDKAQFWQRWAGTPMNARQTLVLNRVLDGVEGKLTNAKWAAMGKCSADTALRDINDLVERVVLARLEGGGRSTGYLLVK